MRLYRTIVAAAVLLALGACATTSGQTEAGRELGRVAAGVTVADQPVDCGKDTPHSALPLGRESVTAARAEYAQVDAANAKRRACFTFNKVQIDGLRGQP